MIEYRLQADEVQLYSGSVYCCDSNGKAIVKNPVPFMLTNINLVFTFKTKKLFQKEETSIEILPISNIKMYNGMPQIKHDGHMVAIFLTTCEKYLSFESKVEARKFVSQTTNLLTGQTMIERGAGKLRDTLHLVDDTLGINTIDTVKNVIENGVTGLLFGKKKDK